MKKKIIDFTLSDIITDFADRMNGIPLEIETNYNSLNILICDYARELENKLHELSFYFSDEYTTEEQQQIDRLYYQFANDCLNKIKAYNA